MAKEREQSAIDAIYDLLEEVRDIKKEIKIINNNIKLLNNKVAKLTLAARPSQEVRPSAGTPSAKVPSAKVPSAKIPVASAAPVTSDNDSGHEIKLFSRIKNQRKKPIKGVYVKIYDPQGNVIKSRTTDEKGYWEARVPPGTYVVELNAQHIIKKSTPMNLNISVNETMNEYEVK